MSIEAINWIWKNCNQTGNRLLLMLAIADSAGDDGICYPGIDRLQKKIRLKSKRGIQKLLDHLEEVGELVITVGDGIETAHGHTNRYYLKRYCESVKVSVPNKLPRSSQMSQDWQKGMENHRQKIAAQKERGEQPDTSGVNGDSPQGVNGDSPYPSVDPLVDPSDLSSKEKESFEDTQPENPIQESTNPPTPDTPSQDEQLSLVNEANAPGDESPAEQGWFEDRECGANVTDNNDNDLSPIEWYLFAEAAANPQHVYEFDIRIPQYDKCAEQLHGLGIIWYTRYERERNGYKTEIGRIEISTAGKLWFDRIPIEVVGEQTIARVKANNTLPMPTSEHNPSLYLTAPETTEEMSLPKAIEILDNAFEELGCDKFWELGAQAIAETIVVNFRDVSEHWDVRFKEWDDPRYVYIGRANPSYMLPQSDWANLFIITPEQDRAQVIERYRNYIQKQPELMARLEELRGRILVCWCAPDECHGDVLVELLNRKDTHMGSATSQPDTEPVSRLIDEHHAMFDAIVAAFGWSQDEITPGIRGNINKTSKELRDVKAAPEDIPGLYAFCTSREWGDNFSPRALSKWYPEYRKSVREKGAYCPKCGAQFKTLYNPDSTTYQVCECKEQYIIVSDTPSVYPEAPELPPMSEEEMLADLRKRRDELFAKIAPGHTPNDDEWGLES